jgi:hypothetical protein
MGRWWHAHVDVVGFPIFGGFCLISSVLESFLSNLDTLTTIAPRWLPTDRMERATSTPRCEARSYLAVIRHTYNDNYY